MPNKVVPVTQIAKEKTHCAMTESISYTFESRIADSVETEFKCFQFLCQVRTLPMKPDEKE